MPPYANFTIGVVVLASLYAVLSPLIWMTLGYGRTVQDLHDFNATCETVEDLGLEGCEDMWFHEKSGLLYMACGSTTDRMGWLPSMDCLNVTTRTGKDRIAILDTRASGSVSSRLKWASTIGYTGAGGGTSLDLHGLDIFVGPGEEPMLKLLLINHRPPVNANTRQIVDATSQGANSTIEVFEAKLGDPVLRHIKTYHEDTIQTPNRVAWLNRYDFVFTNDKSSKVGWTRQAEILTGGGSVGYCNKTTCSTAVAHGLNYPNGLVRGPNDYIYVPSSITGKIHVMALLPTNTLHKIHTIRLPYPIDNLRVDSKGDIYAATFPRTHEFIEHQKHPYDIRPPAAVWRIRKIGDDPLAFETSKVLEGSGEFLPSATVAIHDPLTNRFFLGGAVSPFISICQMNP